MLTIINKNKLINNNKSKNIIKKIINTIFLLFD